MPATRECLECLTIVPVGFDHCPKCDAILGAQTDGSISKIDIAHNHETIPIALGKLDRAIQHHRSRLTQSLRVVVGRGKIGDAVRNHLSKRKSSGAIKSFQDEAKNPGAILVRLK